MPMISWAVCEASKPGQEGRKGGRKGGHCHLQGQEGQTQQQPFPCPVIYVTERFPLRGLRQNQLRGITPTPPVPQGLCSTGRAKGTSLLPSLVWGQAPSISSCSGGCLPTPWAVPLQGSNLLHSIPWRIPLSFTSFHRHQPLPKTAAAASACILISIHWQSDSHHLSHTDQPRNPSQSPSPAGNPNFSWL